MGDLRRELAKGQGRLSGSFERPGTILEDEIDAGDSSSASSVSSTGTLVPQSTSKQSTSLPTTSWHEYFEQELYLEEPANTPRFHVYLTPPRDPSKDPLFVCHHGAGSCGLSFAQFALHLRQRLPNCGILSAEARDHGYAPAPPSVDFSLKTLTSELISMINLTQEKMGWDPLPSLVLVGHSLGGAVVTNAATKDALASKLIGYAVIDVVEGSAVDALKSMRAFLAARPSSFTSMDAATDWIVRSRTVRNAESARLSTPPLIRETGPERWTWRTDLFSTVTFWDDWFDGMSNKFLSGKGAKLLILAGTDRLDKELTIGQMQGKFQLQVFPEAGHFVQEDSPEKTADIVAEFYQRNDQSKLVLPPKVSDLLAQGKKV